MQLAVVVLSPKPLRVPVQRSAHRPPALVPLTNPNERRSRACSPAQAPPTLAGRGRRHPQSSARSPAISRNAPPGPPGLPMPRPSLGGRPWPDSSVTAANWPPVPTSPWGRQPTPKDRAALAPGGDRSWRCSTAQPASELRPGGSGCATQGEPRGPSSALRTVLTAADPRDQSNPEPPLTPSPERVPRVAHAALGCAILAPGESSRSTGRRAREPPLVQAVVVVSSDGSTQM